MHAGARGCRVGRPQDKAREMGVVPSHTENYCVLCRKSKAPSWAETEKEEFFPALYAGLWIFQNEIHSWGVQAWVKEQRVPAQPASSAGFLVLYLEWSLKISIMPPGVCFAAGKRKREA